MGSASALIAEQTGFIAIGTPSVAIARSHGVDDGT
ncbi:isocitrate lyase/phosphoenolpyruvate mutase family protein [Vibrio lentus]|nr:isocitrate lyase/phosphoenolpyruvate mutase family protein [Vibrio lentus]